MNANIQENEAIDVVWRGTLAIAAVAVFAMLPLEALAAAPPASTANAFEILFCNIVSFFTGTIGKALATIALIIIGIGALMGKVSWGMAIIVAIGVALIFGAASIVEALGASSTANCPTGTQTF